MISELKFSTGYTSFWKQTIPHAQQFIRLVNLAGYGRITTSGIKSDSPTHKRAVINEVGFGIYHYYKNNNNITLGNELIGLEAVKEIENKTKTRISLFNDNTDITPLSKEELGESVEIAKNLNLFFKKNHPNSQIKFYPKFNGCGFINYCEGDIIADSTLYEIKSGDRNFLSTDLRQLLIYAALDYASGNKLIKKIGLINPRLSIYYVDDIDRIILELSGKYSFEVFEEIIYFISNDLISK